ncbi:hypothetical protein ACJJTC_012125 [Scirpophaga incertulas]
MIRKLSAVTHRVNLTLSQTLMRDTFEMADKTFSSKTTLNLRQKRSLTSFNRHHFPKSQSVTPQDEWYRFLAAACLHSDEIGNRIRISLIINVCGQDSRKPGKKWMRS